ncbi:MAG: response regulator [Bdellovibrionales bacterium]|jgi:response regulator RpfG family c-di-GMP phosphodiesterase|nr:response regulator [Bdellovibrionales bacterium]MBT3526668.1 response regulator [Bdellovibrionales bacterium]MBT7670190.1 response regulator [Bdellovibrionales bacterium]
MDDEKYTIMLVDDEDDILLALEGALEDDYNIITANSGEEALLLIEEEDFELIICDMRMPGIQGYDVLKAVVEKDESVRRILLTGYSDIESAQAAITLGKIHQHESKPINIPKLTAIIESELREHQKGA